MKKTILELIACWVLVCLLTGFLSDRERFTFTFEEGMLPWVVISRQEAEQAEREAADVKFRVQHEAGEQNYSGAMKGFGKLDFADTRRAADEDGLNLMWGIYDLTIQLNEAGPFEFTVFCAGKQSFIIQNETETGDGTVHSSFTVTDSVEHIRLVTDSVENVRQVVVTKRGTTGIDPDVLAYMILAGIALSVLIQFGNENRVDSRERRTTVMILMFLTVFASFPLFWRGIYNGHDLLFHANRIEGIAAALREGQFPVRIHASTMQGYGYAVSEFYPELFFYLPAVLRNLGVTLAGSIRVLVVLINAATVLSCYLSMKQLCRRRDMALAVTVLYTVSIFRLVNLYTRATYGESIAMIFFPMLILAMAEMLTGDAKRWPLLALAMTGICSAHLLSTLFCTVFCAVAAVICLPNLLREPKRILAILAAAAITAVCSVGLFVPMLDYLREGINTNVSLKPQDHTLTLGGLLVGFAGNKGTVAPELEDYACHVGVVPGLAIMIGICLFALWYYRERRMQNPDDAYLDRLSGLFLILGGITLFMTTDAFPWNRVDNMRWPFANIARQMQFPWRLVGPAVALLSVTAAWGYLRNSHWRRAGVAVMMVLGILPAAYTMQCKIEEAPLIYQDSYTTSWIGQSEYLYLFTDNEALWPGDLHFRGLDPREITDYEKQGTHMSFTVRTVPGDHLIDLPLLYYKGYRVEADNCGQIDLVKGPNNVLQLQISDMGEEVHFRVWFEAPVKWTVASCISGLGLVFLLVLAILDMRRMKHG